MDNTRNVLVTGASGFIGGASVKALVRAGWRVTCGGRSRCDILDCDFIHLDLLNPGEILALATTERFDAIVHLGAQVNLSGVNDDGMYLPNVISTGCLAHLAKCWGAHFIFSSTAIVCGVRNNQISELSAVVPDTEYARTKWLAEQLTSACRSKHCILRVGGVFGLNGPEHLGLNRAINDALKGIPPSLVGSGSALRNYIYVKDVANTIVFILENDIVGTRLLSGSDVHSIRGMLDKVCDVFLPGQTPVIKDGGEASDQVVSASPAFPRSRSFMDALVDIRESGQ